MGFFFLSTCLYHTHTQCPQRTEEGVQTLRTGVTDSCEPPHGYWELDLDPRQENPTLLTTESLLQSQDLFFVF